ncbi:hypothetical protein J4H86_02895 [Spiractinospora alimapuensis]|uniref:hypothetical protein n=1 Tax=Spiractinospora alimapuensis TaxID=2820884 RepID=UPI001F2E6031|nr:hypothetical protein [Spiractinospora alimapuensis]QVQ52792.1 hypothetical protein J4H86_02895 [Spiractinospora alimapuensis]
MNSTSRLLMILCVTSVALALTAPLLGWWVLIPGVALLVAAGALFLTRGGARPTAPQERTTFPATPAPEPPDEPSSRRKHLVRESFASAREDYRFLLSAVVCWRGPDLSDHKAEAAAILNIRERAGHHLRSEDPDEFEAVRHQLAFVLSGGPCPHPGVSYVWAEDVQLELADSDRERLTQLREVRKKQAAREEERALERLERQYLGEDALADPGRALVWWLARNPDRVEDTVERIGTLSTLSAAATGAPVPQLYRDLSGSGPESPPPNPTHPPAAERPSDPAAPDPRDLWVTVVADAAKDMDGFARETFVDRLTEVLSTHGNREYADHLRAAFDVPGLDDPPTPEPLSDEPLAPHPDEWSLADVPDTVQPSNGAAPTPTPDVDGGEKDDNRS